MQNYNQNQYGNQGYPQQQQPQYNNNQYGNQGYPQQPQQQQQYNNNQYGNAYTNNQNSNWQPPPNQNQQYNQPNNNWQPPPNQNQQYNNNQPANNWQPPPNQDQQYNNNQSNNKSWQTEPTTKVTQNGNITVTETTQSGGGKSSNRSDVEFTGPGHFGPGNVTSSGPYQPANDQEKYDYFRLKLYESSCCCACNGGNQHPCLNLWIWAIFWLLIFIFNGLINLIGSLARVSRSDSTGTYSVISIIIIIASLCVNIAAMYGLFKLKPVTFLVQIIFFIVFLLLVIIGLFVYELSLGFVIMNGLFIVCDLWALFVFWRVYRWGKYFKSGGKYEPDMNTPP